jgi:hypothetical protein
LDLWDWLNGLWVAWQGKKMAESEKYWNTLHLCMKNYNVKQCKMFNIGVSGQYRKVIEVIHLTKTHIYVSEKLSRKPIYNQYAFTKWRIAR